MPNCTRSQPVWFDDSIQNAGDNKRRRKEKRREKGGGKEMEADGNSDRGHWRATEASRVPWSSIKELRERER